MLGIAGLVLMSAIGVDYGWKKTDDGNLEYIIQIKPEQIQSLAEGDDIASYIHADVDPKRVTCFRIQVGNNEVPRETVLTPNGPIEASPASGIDDPYSNHRPTLRNPNYSRVSDQGQYGPAPYGSAPYGQNQNYSAGSSQYGPLTQHYGPSQDYPSSWGTNAQRQDPYANSYSQRIHNNLDPAEDPLMHRYGSTSGNNGFTNYNNYNYNNALAAAQRAGTTQTYRAGTTPGIGVGVNQTYNRQQIENPWWGLTFTTVLLFLSLGGNAYLGWIAAEFYTRYRDTVERMRAERRY